ncbi:unnamed protein product [Strongylus vulgaris]|uniref:Uncharacterized protein n=1 Tax=Strongylus vulgaris TaxID=40348 RepID=A0A3P7JCF6_STRVU|nr:unnamed protein product [Strongylus vulgaris]
MNHYGECPMLCTYNSKLQGDQLPHKPCSKQSCEDGREITVAVSLEQKCNPGPEEDLSPVGGRKNVHNGVRLEELLTNCRGGASEGLRPASQRTESFRWKSLSALNKELTFPKATKN